MMINQEHTTDETQIRLYSEPGYGVEVQDPYMHHCPYVYPVELNDLSHFCQLSLPNTKF